MKYILQLVILLFAFAQLNAQQKEITGIVKNNKSKKPIAGVMIYVEGTNRHSFTDINGYFKLNVNTSDELVFFNPSYNSARKLIKAEQSVYILLSVKRPKQELVKAPIKHVTIITNHIPYQFATIKFN